MTTTRLINLKCPICEETFNTFVTSSCGFGSKRTDFRPNYWGLNPVENFYHLCPNCGFCSSKRLYSLKILNTDVKEKIKELGTLIEITLARKLERKNRCLEILDNYNIVKLDKYTFAENWLEVFWWAENKEDKKKYGIITINNLEKLIENNQLPRDCKIKYIYLLGEINRRIGNKNEANSFFDKVMFLTSENKANNFLFNLAKQQKEHPKENIETNSFINLF